MIRATPEELAHAPAGRFVAGESFVHFCAEPELWGIVLWGRPGKPQAMQLGSTLVLELAPPAVPHASILDASRLDASDPGAFKAAQRYVTHYQDLLAQWITRMALIRPPGMSGATVSGAYEIIPKPYPVAIFEDTQRAFAWLAPKYKDTGPAMLEDLYAQATGTDRVLGELRVYLEARLLDAEMASTAAALGLSPRTLQRKLGASSTTFKRELAEARIRVAKRKLLESDAPLTAIAFDVGCASLQHFSATFRKSERISPSEFRARSAKRGP
jgi:AraC-like DNA-binding protein